MNDWVAAADAVGKIVNGNAAGFFVLFCLVITLGVVVRRLWTSFELQMGVMRKDLEHCQRGHANCEAHTRVLTLALLEHTQGKTHAAKARAETLMEMPPRG